jgi:hypothetical protein
MDIKNHLRRARGLATLLDSKFSIAGISFGLDPILDFVPGIGSFVGAITSCYIFWIASKLKVPGWIYFRMTINIFLDFVLGEIPIIGIVFDVFYKSNLKNIALLEKFVPQDAGEVLEGEVLN